MNELRDWTFALCSTLGLETDRTSGIEHELVLDLTRGVARIVTTRADTVTAYLVGMAVARGTPPAEAASRLHELTLNWPRIDWRD